MIDHLLPTDFFHHGIRQEGDLRLICHLFLQYLRATQFLSAVNQIHFFTSGCQIQGIFQCHISTAATYEALAFATCFGTEDQKDAMKAFVEKKKLDGFKNR